MKITASTTALAKALSIVGRAAAKNPTQQILSAVHLLAETNAGTNVLTMTANNSELSISLRCSANIVEKGELAVPAKMLADVVSSLPEGTAELSGSPDGVQLSAAGNSYTIRAYDPADFPAPAQPAAEADSFRLSSTELTDATNTVLVATSKEANRPVLTGVLATFERYSATFVATDSYRMCLRRIDLQDGPEQPAAAIIPADTLREVARLASLSDSLRVATTEHRVMFTVGGVVITSSLISGSFPGYEKMLPESFAREFAVDAKAMKDALKRINLFTEQKGGHLPVRMVFSPAANTEEQTPGGLLPQGGTLTLSAQSPQIGAATEVLDATVAQGRQQFDISFNGSYLADGIDVALRTGAEKVLLQANDPMKPAMLRTRSSTKDSANTAAEATTSDAGAGDTGEPVKDSSTRHGTSDDVPDGSASASAAPAAAANEYSSGLSYLIMPMRDPNRNEQQEQGQAQKQAG